jgi:hypothetical protein
MISLFSSFLDSQIENNAITKCLNKLLENQEDNNEFWKPENLYKEFSHFAVDKLSDVIKTTVQEGIDY